MPTLTINGQSYFSDSPPDTPLLWVIREELRLTGTKFGCGIAMCGACTVHLNGQAVRSCAVMVGDVGDASITTIEGLDPADRIRSSKRGSSCRCRSAATASPGQIMQASALLAQNPSPTDEEIVARDERQPVPLRHLSAHRRRRSSARRKS